MSVRFIPQTVFIIDDEPLVLRATSRVLRAAGNNVATFNSPEEFLRQYHPDASGCLVLDVSMPGMGGLALQERLEQGGNHVPIIFLTGYGDPPIIERAMKAGAVAFLIKPCTSEELLAAIQRAFIMDRNLRERRAEKPRS
jgi:FixJ family two-component response regulator